MMPLEPAIEPNLATGLVNLRPRVLKRTLSSQLARLAAGFADRPVRLGELIDVLQLRGYDAVLIFLAFPFITPVPLPGFSSIFGTVIALLKGSNLHREAGLYELGLRFYQAHKRIA